MNLVSATVQAKFQMGFTAYVLSGIRYLDGLDLFGFSGLHDPVATIQLVLRGAQCVFN
jgi:hypothetical protein